MTEEQRIREAIALDDPAPRIDRNSGTWKAIREFMKEKAKDDYMPTLRNQQLDYSQVQYARGALDAFDSLLEHAGENI
jgi:hypothetical protein